MNTWMISLQESNSPLYDMMIFFHDLTMMMIILIMIMITYILYFVFFNKFSNRFLLENHLIELIWTTMPMLILIIIALPSIKILYLMDEIYLNKITIKAIGHQWYWSYEYSDFLNIEFDSYMILSQNLKINEFRLLEVDNRCVLPFNYPIRILTSSMDVIHAWTIPSLGIKMDSTPGRLNQSLMYMYRPGIYFGQCSEICGINHSYMPIIIESTNLKNFINWMKTFN